MWEIWVVVSSIDHHQSICVAKMKVMRSIKSSCPHIYQIQRPITILLFARTCAGLTRSCSLSTLVVDISYKNPGS